MNWILKKQKDSNKINPPKQTEMLQDTEGLKNSARTFESSKSETGDWDISFPPGCGGLFIPIQTVFGQIIKKEQSLAQLLTSQLCDLGQVP